MAVVPWLSNGNIYFAAQFTDTHMHSAAPMWGTNVFTTNIPGSPFNTTVVTNVARIIFTFWHSFYRQSNR